MMSVSRNVPEALAVVTGRHGRVDKLYNFPTSTLHNQCISFGAASVQVHDVGS